MTHPAPAHAIVHRHALSGIPAPRWISVVAASLTIAAIPAIAPPLASKDVHIVAVTQIDLAAATFDASLAEVTPRYPATVDSTDDAPAAFVSPPVNSALSGPSVVIDDFVHGGLARVLLHQLTSRTTDPDQLQILHDFFEGGVFQSEAHRFLQLFTDPQQQEFINDFVTGGVIQIVRNRLLDATSSPEQRAAIIAFFPDEVTDYRGGIVTVLQRRLIAAAKGNAGVIALVNAVFDNPIVGVVRQLVGGGPLVGTALESLPDKPVRPSVATRVENPGSGSPDRAVVETAVSSASAASTTAMSAAPTAAPEPAASAESASPPPQPSASSAKSSPTSGATTQSVTAPATSPAAAEPSTHANPGALPAKATVDATDTDVIKTGNKVEPTTAAGTKRPKPGGPAWRVFGQVAEAVVAGLGNATAPTPVAGAADDAGAKDAGGDAGAS